MTSLDLALVGNGTIGALINPTGDVVWGCFPRFDGDPMFCSLLRDAPGEDHAGEFRVRTRQPDARGAAESPQHGRSS